MNNKLVSEWRDAVWLLYDVAEENLELLIIRIRSRRAYHSTGTLSRKSYIVKWHKFGYKLTWYVNCIFLRPESWIRRYSGGWGTESHDLLRYAMSAVHKFKQWRWSVVLLREYVKRMHYFSYLLVISEHATNFPYILLNLKKWKPSSLKIQNASSSPFQDNLFIRMRGVWNMSPT
jgi:hypothetical protein